MIYAIALAIALAIAGGAGFYGGQKWVQADWDADKAARLEAEAEVARQARVIEQQAANTLIDMDAAYQAGEANARVIVKTVYARGQDYAAKDKGLSNPACVMSDDSLRFLRTALAGMRSPADPGGPAPAVPGSGTAGGRDVQRPVPQQPAEYGTMGPVHSDAGQAGSSGQVPGPSLRPPKPTPRAKQ